MVEIQEGKTTIVSIVKLATYNLFDTWSCLAAPLREGGREAQTGLLALGSAPSVTVNLLVFELCAIVWLIRNSHLYVD